MGCIGFSCYNLLFIVLGVFGVFFKCWVIEVGGYFYIVGEDMEFVVCLY